MKISLVIAKNVYLDVLDVWLGKWFLLNAASDIFMNLCAHSLLAWTDPKIMNFENKEQFYLFIYSLVWKKSVKHLFKKWNYETKRYDSPFRFIVADR